MALDGENTNDGEKPMFPNMQARQEQDGLQGRAGDPDFIHRQVRGEERQGPGVHLRPRV